MQIIEFHNIGEKGGTKDDDDDDNNKN